MTLEPQDDVRGSWFERRLAEPSFVIPEIADFRRQRVGAVEREGASEVVSVEPSPPDPVSKQYQPAVGVRTDPQVARHEAYETAFLGVPDADLTP